MCKRSIGNASSQTSPAEVYGPYTNEDLVGEARVPIRGQVAIASKFGIKIDPGEQQAVDCRPENIGAVTVELTPEDLREIDSAASKITIQGARYPEALETRTGL